jgi:hypothetical protein
MRLPIERIQFSASDVDADSGQGTIALILLLAPGLTFTASFFVALSDEHLHLAIREAHQVFGRLGQTPNVVERFQSILRLLRGQHFEFGHLRSHSMEAGVFYVRVIQAALTGAPSRC